MESLYYANTVLGTRVKYVTEPALKELKSNETHTYEYGSGFSLLNPTGCILKIQIKYINSKTITINKTMFL